MSAYNKNYQRFITISNSTSFTNFKIVIIYKTYVISLAFISFDSII